MKKSFKIILLILIIAVNVFAGCTNNSTNGSTESNSAVEHNPPDVDVWGAYATAKVIQDPAYNDNYKKLEAAIDVYSCLGEEEDGQIIITTHERVNSYSLKTSDLKNADGDVFSTENIWVYNQFYHEIYMKSQGQTLNSFAYPLGFIPDALIPQAGSERNKENFIESGKNQGITVTFNVPSDQKPGVYTGEFSLVIDGFKKAIPVRLTVWNIDNTYMHGYTAWDLWSGRSLVELDSVHFESFQRCIDEEEYDFWVSKRQNPMRLPAELEGAEAWAENVASLWSNPRFNSFVFDDFEGNKDKIKEYVMALVKVADRDQINYLQAASFYEKQADEPHPGTDHYVNCVNWCRSTIEALEEIADDVSNDSSLFSQDPELKKEVIESIRGIRFLITITQTYEILPEDTLNLTNSLCAQLNCFATVSARDYYNSRVEEGNFSTWTYTCMYPLYPMPSQAVDDYSLGIRLIGWMRKQYNIEGYLNWNGNMVNSSNVYYSGYDAYEDVLRLYLSDGQFLNGDGFLVYPGKRYDQTAPIGSIRMNAFRDMQEDYDMLSVFEEKFDSLVEKYGVTSDQFTSDNLLNPLYQGLYEGVVYYTDEELVMSAREQLANWMIGMNENNLLLNYTKQGDMVKISLCSDADKIFINGIETFGSDLNYGKIYQRELMLQEKDTEISVRVVKNGKSNTYLFNVGQKTFRALDSSNISPSQVYVSSGSSFDADTGLFTMRTGGETFTDQLVFRLQAKIAFNESLSKSDINTLSFNVYNENDFDISVKFGYYKDSAAYNIETYTIKAHSFLTITDLRVFDTDWNKKEIDGIVLTFANLDDNQNPYPERKLRIGDVYYTKNNGGK